ncbi:Outer membrane efflux protein [Sulfurimonas denitrificans DSM 1251]|uniref:Outer membrane efflux protein n=1 Tax=Sulfurimonas denitrificans (strain ATCC 33889 / DSM 1251) TaxID=326298 RepID=Q30RA8_SULDN|nr:TolC family protein [Sulfurimonas denitrificans]ABB44473.1 Outer membrane efflux protein [Sulfurimonas denitrificans DSM 1251]MDD3441655.1 TolC family protein [Sulfurimonas denitrificans]
MKKAFVLIFFIFSFVSYSKEIKKSELNTDLIAIKIGSFNSLDNALDNVKAISDKYDILTLKGNDYNQYVVNITPESYNTTLADVKKNHPDAFKTDKLSFKTDGIILGSTAEDSTETKKESDKPATDNLANNRTTPKSEEISLNLSTIDESLLKKSNKEVKSEQDLSNSVQNIIKIDIPKESENSQLYEIKNIINVDVKKPKVLAPQDKKVDLIDVVLQTISASHKVLSSREKMVQAKRNIDIAFANYYPSVDAIYTLGKTERRPGDKENGALNKVKYYGDEIYSLKVTQNVYAGGETQNSVEQLRANYLVAKVDFERLLEEESIKAINSYIDVVFSRDALEANKKNIEELETILEIVKIKYDAGALSIGELSNIEASVSNAKSQLSRTTSRYTNALEYFKFIAGESFKDMYPYEKVTQVTLRDFDALLESSLKCNNTLRSFEYDILSSKHNLKKLKSPFRPKVDLVAGIDKVADKEYFENVEDSYYAKMVLSYNLFNGGRDEAEYLKAYSVLKEKSYDKEAEIRKVKWSLEKFYTSITSLQNNMSNVESEVNASRSMVASYWESFKHGEQDLYILLQAQRQLNTAELDFIQTQQDSMKDYFEILRLLGDLLNYFGMDINDDAFLDMAKANYRAKNNIIGNTKKDDAKAEPKIAVIKESAIVKEEVKKDIKEEKTQEETATNDERVTKEDSSLETLLSFNESFLLQNPSSYTIVISKLKSPVDALKVISELSAEDKSFMYEFFQNKKVKTNIAYGIFNSIEEAKESMNSELSEFTDLTIESVGKVQNDFRDYFKLSFLNADEVIKVKTKKEAKETKVAEIPFTTNELFKKEFLSAPKEFFTINITTLSSMEIAGRVVKDANIDQRSFAFAFGKDSRWIKLMMGVYATYDEAKEALNALGDIKTKYNPVIEKIALKQELYEKFNKQ